MAEPDLARREPRLRFVVSAEVRGTPEQVADVLATSWFRARVRGVEVAPGRVVSQGGWWYRGEYTLEQEGGRSRLVHRVYDVSPRLRWAVPLANRMFVGYRRHLQAGIERLAADLADRLEPGASTR